MKKYKNILNQLKGEFTIKDLQLVVRKYKPMGYWRKLIISKSSKDFVAPLNISKKEFDKWVIKFMKNFYVERPDYGTNTDYLHIFFLILKEKAKQNTLFVEFLENPNMKEIEKNIKNFLKKFKGNYTEKILKKEIDNFILDFWEYNDLYANIYDYYDRYYNKIEKEPFDLKKKEFNFWVVNQIKNFYKNNFYLQTTEIYIQFFLVYVKKAKIELIKKNLNFILKKLEKSFNFLTLSKLMYKFCPNFEFKFKLLNTNPIDYKLFFIDFRLKIANNYIKISKNFIIDQALKITKFFLLLKNDIYFILFYFFIFKINLNLNILYIFFKNYKKFEFIKSKLKRKHKYIFPYTIKSNNNKYFNRKKKKKSNKIYSTL